MKIYQVHEYTEEWEYFHDYIIGSYFSKERAEEEKVKAEAEAKRQRANNKRCCYCPFLDEYEDDNLDYLMERYPDYCPEMKFHKTEWGLTCDNYCSKWDDSTFEVKEVEVLE